MTGRNDPCPCGSGRRYKHCHGAADSPDALAKQGLDAHQRGEVAAAERLYREALATAPEHPLALHYLGVALYQQKRPAEALPLLDRAAALVPAEPEFHNNRGLALEALGRLADAIGAYRRALDLKPAHAGAWSNLGRALQAEGNVDAAIDAFRRGIAAAPVFPQLHWNLALALLLQGDYANGWREYEWRVRTPELAATLRADPAPRWDGASRDQTLLVTAEQGLGDAIQFLRFASRIPSRVIVAVPSALRSLAATAPGIAAAVTLDEELPAHDAHVPLMSLPAILGMSLADVATEVPYLRVDGERRRAAASSVARERGLKVGVAWSGAPTNTDNATRSVALASLAPLFDIEGVRLFSLKRDADTIDDDRPWSRRMVELDMRNDFDGLAALVDSLDLVVSVDTSIAHLAGALGKPVWVLLRKTPDWRWLLERDDSPWYPTARLWRQQVRGDWTAPVAAIADALRRQELR
jgi:Flp pilus assembly protein TadD